MFWPDLVVRGGPLSAARSSDRHFDGLPNRGVLEPFHTFTPITPENPKVYTDSIAMPRGVCWPTDFGELLSIDDPDVRTTLSSHYKTSSYSARLRLKSGTCAAHRDYWR